MFLVSGHSIQQERNPTYLRETGRSLARVLGQDLGLTVEVREYADELYSWDSGAGFIELSVDMNAVALQWQLDPGTDWTHEFINPTRAIVVAHSHGTVWAHHAVESSPELLVDLLVDFDGVSVNWEVENPLTLAGDNWTAAIDEFYDEQGSNPWRHDVRFAHGWKVGDGAVADIEDIVPDNVVGNLEFWADPYLEELLFGVYDEEPNTRWDGGVDNILTIQSSFGHTGLYKPGSDAVSIVEEALRKAYGRGVSR